MDNILINQVSICSVYSVQCTLYVWYTVHINCFIIWLIGLVQYGRIYIIVALETCALSCFSSKNDVYVFSVGYNINLLFVYYVN